MVDTGSGCEALDFGALNGGQRMNLVDFKINTRIDNEKYLRSHKEVELLLSGFLREVLMQRPENIREFAAGVLCSYNEPPPSGSLFASSHFLPSSITSSSSSSFLEESGPSNLDRAPLIARSSLPSGQSQDGAIAGGAIGMVQLLARERAKDSLSKASFPFWSPILSLKLDILQLTSAVSESLSPLQPDYFTDPKLPKKVQQQLMEKLNQAQG